MTKVQILTILKWTVLIFIVVILAWYAFSHSPTLEQFFALLTSGLFLYLALENRSSTMQINERLDYLIQNSQFNQKLDKLDKLDEVSACLQKLVKLQEDKQK